MENFTISSNKTLSILKLLVITFGSIIFLYLAHNNLFADYNIPGWWGTGAIASSCDPNTYTQHEGVPDGAKSTDLDMWNGVASCDPRPIVTADDVTVNFGSGKSQNEWECVEMVERYLYTTFHSSNGFIPYNADGADVVSAYNNSSSNITPINVSGGNPNHYVPSDGDVLSFGTYGGAGGHTAIVTHVTTIDSSNGYYTFTIFQQNAQHAYDSQDITMSKWVMSGTGYPSPINGWLHIAPPAPDLELSPGTGISIPSNITIGQNLTVTYNVTNVGGTTQTLDQLWLAIDKSDGTTLAFDVGGDGNSNSIGVNQSRAFSLPIAGFGLNCGHSITTTNCGYGTYIATAKYEDSSGNFHDLGQQSFTLAAGPSYGSSQEVIIRNYNGGLWEAFKTNSSGVVEFSYMANQGWWPISTGQTTFNPSGKISVVLNNSNLLEVFARDTNGNIWYSMQTSPGQGSFTQWYELTTDTFNGDPFAIMNNGNQVQVFARGSDNTIKTNWISLGGAWQPHWISLTSDTMSGDPVAIDRIDKNMNQNCPNCALLGGTQVFVLQNSTTIGTYYGTPNGWAYQSLATYSSGLTNPKVILSPIYDTLQIFARSGSNDVTLEEQPGGVWPSSWLSLPGSSVSITGDPQPVIEIGGAVVVYSASSDGTIRETWNNHLDQWNSSWVQQSTSQVQGNPTSDLDGNPSADELWANFADGSGLYADWITSSGSWSGWNWEEYFQ